MNDHFVSKIALIKSILSNSRLCGQFPLDENRRPCIYCISRTYSYSIFLILRLNNIWRRQLEAKQDEVSTGIDSGNGTQYRMPQHESCWTVNIMNAYRSKHHCHICQSDISPNLFDRYFPESESNLRQRSSKGNLKQEHCGLDFSKLSQNGTKL